MKIIFFIITDSFQDNLLAPPVYSRPEDFRGHKVPEILLSGNLKAIELWREEQAYEGQKTDVLTCLRNLTLNKYADRQ